MLNGMETITAVVQALLQLRIYCIAVIVHSVARRILNGFFEAKRACLCCMLLVPRLAARLTHDRVAAHTVVDLPYKDYT